MKGRGEWRQKKRRVGLEKKEEGVEESGILGKGEQGG